MRSSLLFCMFYKYAETETIHIVSVGYSVLDLQGSDNIH